MKQPLSFFVAMMLSTLHAYMPGEDRFVALPHSAGIGGNAAALSAFDSPGWLFSYREDEASQRDLRLGAHGEEAGAFFRWTSGPSGYDRSEWALLGSLPDLQRTLFTGFRFSLLRSSEFSGNAWSMSPGLLWRPFSFFALGLGSEALVQAGPYQQRSQHMGASLRPWRSFGLSYEASFANRTQLAHYSSRVEQSLLAEFGLWGMDLSLTLPINDPYGNQAYALQVALPLGSYRNLSVGADREDDSWRLRSVQLAGHSARDPQVFHRPVLVRVPLGTHIRETEPGFSLLGPGGLGLSSLRNHFAHLQADASANPILFDFSGYTAGPAISTEIRRGIQALRAHGKKVLAYVDDARPSVLLAASAADRIVLQPSARVEFRGLSSGVMYYKGLLDWAGIKADMLRHGRYKSAIEPYTADSMSAEARADLQALLRSSWGLVRDSVAASRSLTAAALDSFAANPGITAKAARSVGLADTLLYLDEIPGYASATFGLKTRYTYMADWAPGSEKIFDESWSERPRIAILNIEGTIVDGPGGTHPLTGSSVAGTGDLMDLVDALRKEGDYSALILRINSPGGSALASDELWHRLRSLSEDGMPIIASVGDMAASGGYYLACAADAIVAEPTSIVGSIGIFGGKVDASGLLAKLKVRSENVSTHPHADAESPARGFSEEEKVALQAYMDDFYGRFVNVVAQARGLDSLSVDSLGEGRIYTGAQGLENGLVDELGGMARAISRAKQEAGIREQTPIELVPLQGDGTATFRNLASQAKLLSLRSMLEQPRIWALWSPGLGKEE